jgi:hypothetical protein
MQDIVELILLCLLNFFPLLNFQPVPGNDLLCLVGSRIFGNSLKLYLLYNELCHQAGVDALEFLYSL